MKVILDNGHGRETQGKRSPVWDNGDQLFEYEFNRHIVVMVRMELERLGVDVVVLVPEEEDIPLPERAMRANEIFNQDNDCFLVSIHANAGGGTGWEVFTSKGQTESDVIATSIFNEARKEMPELRMRTDNTDGDPDKEAHFFILRRTSCPAVLTENLFMDNYEDCKKLLSLEWRKKITMVHVNGIMNYINNLK